MKLSTEQMNVPVGSKSRNTQIDTLRFLLILSIYIFHFESVGGKFYDFTGTFHTPGFFMISGFWALKQTQAPAGKFLRNALKKYLIPWFVWVLIYTVTNSVYWACNFFETVELFWLYFCAVRATGIWGMWFTPAFFLVSLAYYFLSKLTARLAGDKKKLLLWSNCIVSFVIFFLYRYAFGNPQDLFFSLHFVPEYLFYYSLGAVIYYYITERKEKFREAPAPKSRWAGFLTVLAVMYTLMIYFGNGYLLWEWAEETVLSFLPEIITACVVLYVLSLLAKYIDSAFTVRIGRATLGLCHAESLIKYTIVLLGSSFGLSVSPNSPTEVIMLSIICLAVGAYFVLPATDKLTKDFTEAIERKFCRK